jgi:hypothetical protein
MTLGVRQKSQLDAALAPWIALGFSLFVAVLKPHYNAWFGDAMPVFIRYYFAYNALWIAINLFAACVQTLVKHLQKSGKVGGFWRKLNALLMVSSIVVVLVGVIAVVVPALHMKPF